jgi:hypothetical protein
MIPNALQEFVDRINLKIRYFKPHNTKTYSVIEQEQSNFDILYQLISYEDPFWATGSGTWYSNGVVPDSDTIVTITGFKHEFDMKLILTGILTGMEIMQ